MRCSTPTVSINCLFFKKKWSQTHPWSSAGAQTHTAATVRLTVRTYKNRQCAIYIWIICIDYTYHLTGNTVECFTFDLCSAVSKRLLKDWWWSSATFVHVYESPFWICHHEACKTCKSVIFKVALKSGPLILAFAVCCSASLSPSSSTVLWVKEEFICHPTWSPWAPRGPCGQMFLQQGFCSSVFSVLELFKDTALMEPRITSLLLTFLWISVAERWHILYIYIILD